MAPGNWVDGGEAVSTFGGKQAQSDIVKELLLKAGADVRVMPRDIDIDISTSVRFSAAGAR